MSDVWFEAMEALRALTHRMADRWATPSAPDRRADLAMKFFGNVMAAYLTHLMADPLNPAFVPSVGYHQMYGSPNPDTVYRTATVDGRGIYELHGYRGTAPDVTIMPFGAPTANGLETFTELNLDDLPLDDSGRFEVTLSEVRPPGVECWWRLRPETRSLMLRSVSHDWGAHSDPRVAIVRTDRAAARSHRDAVSARLQSYSQVVEAMMMSGIRRVEQLRGAGVVNRLVAVDYRQGGARADQWYQEGCFELGPDEALLIETTLPQGCNTFSLSLTDAYFSTIDWAGTQSSLNHEQARIGSDRDVKLVVASTDVGVANWLDTAGHDTGVLQFRWSGGSQAPELGIHKVPVAACAAMHQPGERIDPHERAEAVRRRRVGAQLRSLW